MSSFDEKLKEILHAGVHGHDWDKAIDQIKQLISETIGEDEIVDTFGKTIHDDYYGTRNGLKMELRHAFNLKGTEGSKE